MIFYYSGCGNSRWIAGELAKGLEDKMEFIPELRRKMDEEGGLTVDVDGVSLGFVFPVYAWAAPKLVEEFVLKVSWKVTGLVRLHLRGRDGIDTEDFQANAGEVGLETRFLLLLPNA